MGSAVLQPGNTLLNPHALSQFPPQGISFLAVVIKKHCPKFFLIIDQDL